MPIDASIPLRVNPIQISDPMEGYARAMTISGLVGQNRLQGLQIQQAEQANADDQALRELSPQAGGDVTKLRDLVYNRGLFKQGMALDKQILEKQAKEAEIKKNLATVDKTTLETNTAKTKLLNGAGQSALQAYEQALAQKLPEPMARAMAQPAYEAALESLGQSGIFQPEFLAQQPKQFDPTRVRTALQQTLPYEKFLEDERARRKLAEDARHNTATEANTVRGQNFTLQAAREGHAVTAQGQRLTDARQRDANDIAQGNRQQQGVIELRKEFNALPEVKNYREVVPVINSIKKAPDTPAGDLDLIYGVGKILDPNSVVREGEMALVIKSGSPMQRFQGAVNYITSGRGRLTEGQRLELTNMLDSRVSGLKANHDAARKTYETAADRQGLPKEQIFVESPATTDNRTTAAARKVIDGKGYVQMNGQWYEERRQ